MICDLCRTREAVIFLEQMDKNIKRKINLCAECAAARGIAAPVPAPNQQNVAALFQEIVERNMALDSDSKRVCPSCGKSILDIKQQGIAGCPECYEVFKAEIRESMNAHGITGTYTGSMPLRVKGFRNALTDRADLQAKLDEAVRTENYEKAAVYRDYLRALEKGSVADGSDASSSD